MKAEAIVAPTDLLGYLGTWSAVSAYRKATGEEPIALVAGALEGAWGPRDRPHAVTWKLSIRAGRVGAG